MSAVDYATITDRFETLKRGRRADPLQTLETLGALGVDALTLLNAKFKLSNLPTTRIPGTKQYAVGYVPERPNLFSRPLNRELLVEDPSEYGAEWSAALDAFKSTAGTARASSVDSKRIDRLFYTSVMAYAAVTDVLKAGRWGSPGTLLEIAVGAVISLLTGLEERAGIALNIDDYADPIDVTVDMAFAGIRTPTLPALSMHDDFALMDADDAETGRTLVERPEADPPPSFDEGAGGPALVVPTKLSTRERIVQAYAHQCILNRAAADKYRTILCACNENNLMKPSGQAKQLSNISVTDTLVPRTIVLYQLYVAEISGIYYLDPPPSYLERRWPHFPHVATFGTLLT